MRVLWIVPLCLAGASVASAANLTTSKSFDTKGASTVKIEFSAGELDIGASDTDAVEVTMTARCRTKCGEQRARRLRLVSEPNGSTLVFRVEGQRKSLPGPKVALKFRVPRSMGVHVYMGAGDVAIQDVAGNVKLHMGAGDVTIRSPEEAVHQVDVHVGVGDANLRVGRNHVDGRGFLSKHLKWQEGLGRGLVDVDLGAGDVSVALD